MAQYNWYFIKGESKHKLTQVIYPTYTRYYEDGYEISRGEFCTAITAYRNNGYTESMEEVNSNERVYQVRFGCNRNSNHVLHSHCNHIIILLKER